MSVLKHTMLVLDYAAKTWNDLEINMAVLLHDSGKPICHEKYGNALGHEHEGLPFIENFCEKWKAPNRYRDLALLVCKYHTFIHGVLGRGANGMTRPKSIMKLFEDTAAMKKPDRFEKILKCCIADARGRGATPEQIKEFENQPYPQADYLWECLQAVINTDTKSVSKRLLSLGKEGKVIGLQIRAERIKSIRRIYNSWKH